MFTTSGPRLTSASDMSSTPSCHLPAESSHPSCSHCVSSALSAPTTYWRLASTAFFREGQRSQDFRSRRRPDFGKRSTQKCSQSGPQSLLVGRLTSQARLSNVRSGSESGATTPFTRPRPKRTYLCVAPRSIPQLTLLVNYGGAPARAFLMNPSS